MTEANASALTRARAARAVDRSLVVVAAALALSLAVAGWHDVSQGYDVWYYHLPFAARISGVMNAATYAFSADNQARYDGFPLLAEALQGIVWRITGHIEATNLVSVGALFALPLFLWRVFGVPAHVALIALFAIPLVHIHATAGYVDLPANACATMLLLLAYRAVAFGDARPVGLGELAGAGLLTAATANMKFQLVPIALAASLVIVVVVLRTNRSPRHLALIALAVPLVFATPIKNTIRHGNPVWPVELTIAGHALPHTERAYSQSPPNLEDSPRPVRFFHSVLELESRPLASHARWSLDQWAPADDPTCRMGGYFGAYVAANLAALAAWIIRRRRERRREALAVAGLFAGVTLVASLVPQSHELRYYMHWMLLLVCLNLVLWSREGPVARTAGALVATLALATVAWSTGGGYLYASGTRFADYVTQRTEHAIVDSAAPGDRLCIQREPFTFLYAAPFHDRADYAVQEATRDTDCRGARPVP